MLKLIDLRKFLSSNVLIINYIRCNSGHELIYKEERYQQGYFSCIQCYRQYDSSLKRWHCSTCKADVCFFCRLPGPPGEPLPLPASGTGVHTSAEIPSGMPGGMEMSTNMSAPGFGGISANVSGPMGTGMKVNVQECLEDQCLEDQYLEDQYLETRCT